MNNTEIYFCFNFMIIALNFSTIRYTSIYYYQFRHGFYQIFEKNIRDNGRLFPDLQLVLFYIHLAIICEKGSDALGIKPSNYKEHFVL